MAQVRTNMAVVQRLEERLLSQKNDLQRLVLLDKLAGHFMFTDYKKAFKYLGEIRSILKKYPNPDYLFNYHSHTSFIENQLYNFHIADIHAKKAIDIVEERGEVAQQMDTYIDYAGVCINLNHWEDVTVYLNKATKLLEAFPDERFQARMTAREGILALHFKDFDKATMLLLEADKIINRLSKLTLKDFYFRTIIHGGLGMIFFDTGYIEKSIHSWLRVVNWCESLGMTTRLSWHYLNLGNGYSAIQDDNRARFYYHKAIKTKNDISSNSRAGAYANLGLLYFKEDRFREAAILYNRAEKLYREKPTPDFYNFSVIESRRGELFAKMGKRKRAENHFGTAIEYGRQSEDDRQTADVCTKIAKFYADGGDYRNAYEFQGLHEFFFHRHMSRVNDRTRIELEVKYEAEKKIHEAEVLRLEAMGLQLKALRAQMNPHFLFNALNSIQTFITSDDSGEAAKYLAKFALLMRQSLMYSDMEIVSLEKEVAFLENYLYINQKLRFTNKLDYLVYVDDELEDDIMGIPTMIVQPYVENAIEHGLRPVEGRVTVSFFLHDENTMLCIIEDNGIGREKAAELRSKDPQTNSHKSMGTSITEQRIDILKRLKNDRVKVKTTDLYDEHGVGNGTRVEILLPIETIQG